MADLAVANLVSDNVSVLLNDPVPVEARPPIRLIRRIDEILGHL